ncbi:tetratricopeptide repeat protein [Palleronia aestuarii]|uniref:Tetratricopeptide repeat protein n=1 Tax=Palleronia aestuarii TaxID=568105 RepID=A0A2W7ND15_9RHOB|nr:tetratricopeptide repeat protein [Palleronia aestuarii]PZX16037.1 tetratricopeptide repeat protein [Palleronia aestuarii]
MAILKPLVAAATLILAAPAIAQDARGMDDLFTALGTAEGADADRIVEKIVAEWSKSGSPAMDMLLQRGRDALEAGDTDRAIEHFGALVDHAPDFAEGYNARATAFFADGEYGLAIDDIRHTLDLNPRHFGAMTGLAVILGQIERPGQALEVWRKVLELYPDSPQAAAILPTLEAEVEGSTL